MTHEFFTDLRSIGERTKQELETKGIKAPEYKQPIMAISKTIYLYPPEEGFESDRERDKWIQSKRVKYKIQNELLR
jgi:hypothetical protein